MSIYDVKGRIFDVQRFSVHDGPGIRTTVFLKGCPLRCKWCHNPEGLEAKQQLMYKYNSCTGCKNCIKECNHDLCKGFGKCVYLCPNNCLEVVGKYVEANELCDELIKGAAVLGDTFGGFTFSGGEPLAQPDFLFEVCKELKDFHLCIETSGYASEEVFKRMLSVFDFVIMDIKLASDILHKEYTGVSNKTILSNFNLLKNSGKPFIIRTPLIEGVTDTFENLNAIKEIIGDSNWEKLPYNAAAEAKYKMLNMVYKK